MAVKTALNIAKESAAKARTQVEHDTAKREARERQKPRGMA
jgi:hypothetical protein